VRRFVAVRLLHAVVVLLIVTTIAFFLVHLAPGDPFSFDNPRVSTEVRDEWRRRFGYDRPLAEQYIRYVTSVARGELGYSHSRHMPVSQVLADTVPRTALLMGLALVISFALGIRLGVYEATHLRQRIGRGINGATLLVFSLPDFWLALMLLLTFAYWIPILPAGGMVDEVLHPYMGGAAALWDRMRHLALPLLTLTLVMTAVITRYQRAALADVLPADYVRTARAKGVDERVVVGRHALRNALLPMITLAALSLPALLGGAVFVERVFAWPGMGMMVVTAIFVRDYPLILAAVNAGALMVVLGNFVADVAYGWADPRIRVR